MAATKPDGYPKTPELDKMLAATKEHSQEIGEFLEWLWFDQQVEFFRRIRVDEECYACHGYGHTRGQIAHKPNPDAELGEVEAMLHQVKPQDLGYKCNQCNGKGYINKEKEQGGPENANYWLARYFDIDLEEMDRERMRVLEYVRAQNDRDDSGVS